MTENDLTYKIRGAIFLTYKSLGPGLLESAYESVLTHELKKMNLEVKRQVEIPIIHDGITIESAYRIDLLINDKVLIEIKSIDNLSAIHHKQVITYLKLMNLKLGILVNFNMLNINEGIHRKINTI